MSDEQMIWVRTEPSVDGTTYVASVEFSGDRAIVLTPERATAYTRAVLDAAGRAEYDSAVFDQMKSKVEVDAVAQVILDLRKDRPPLDVEATAPLRLDPGVNSKGKPFLGLFVDDKQIGQWDVDDARQHAMHVMEAPLAADLDAAYRRVLMGMVGLDRAVAENVVDDLGKHR